MNPFLEPSTWQILAAVHPFKPRRYEDDKLVVSFYEMPLNVFTFAFFKLKITWKVRIIGPPLSVSQQGYMLKEGGQINDLLEWAQTQKGLTVILNADDTLKLTSNGLQTLPGYVFEQVKPKGITYMETLRAPYRYKLKKALKQFEAVEKRHLTHETFDHALYPLYEAVFEKSSFPLEKCTRDYFETFPSNILAYYVANRPIGFSQYVIVEDTLYFIFCGLSYPDLKTYALYVNLLQDLVAIGLEKGVKKIDFGQTSDEMKLKLGCKRVAKYMLITHSHPVMRGLLKVMGRFFAFKPAPNNYCVFKEE